ncbi:hypothetical protein B0A49_05407 [Cryomyces minteri]|uniref:Uncharacterized protein n=1 Tax=Cryomyces minteri TaxID=331657 RepID=A0A4U0WJB3_9PEZI|nr:hypothetical protein B0A49_10403 [Cryomyces minteri]TKA63130.1 hypothetical protein B0A49_09485 [Cryomyces minteri]TKA67772.1 hypothetical protein B0A49_05407 [Cryomyces minteri]
MAENVTASSQTRTPLVTEDDLRAFHMKHFGHALSPANFFVGNEVPIHAEENYDDGLGYYPDGVKRTLTDEQIAIFRHSEIQAILKTRRHLREGEEDRQENEGKGVERPEDSSELRQQACSAGAGADAGAETRINWLRQTRTQRSNKNKKSKKKRKRASQAIDSDKEEWTHRRIAREEDEQKATALDLDYSE